jgi:hypothetical protein
MQKKDVGLRIRIERELRDAFVMACQSQDLQASEVLRAFMRSYTQQVNNQAGQLPLPLNTENNH